MLDEFLILVEEVFEKRFFDMPASQIIGGTVIFIVFLAIREFLRTLLFCTSQRSPIAQKRKWMANF